MSLSIDQIAETFCSWKFAETFPYMAEEIKWNVINRAELLGRDAVIEQCGKAIKFLDTVEGTVTRLKSSRSGDTVFVEAAAQFRDKQNRTSSVASCDVFRFSDGQLVEITSYVIDLKTQ